MDFESMLNAVRDEEKEKLITKWYYEGNFKAIVRELRQGLKDSEETLLSLFKELEKGNPNNLYKYTDGITVKLLKSTVFSENEKRLIYALLAYCISKRNLEVMENFANKK